MRYKEKGKRPCDHSLGLESLAGALASLQTFSTGARTTDEIQLFPEMPPEVKRAWGETLWILPSSLPIVSFQGLPLAKPIQGPRKWSVQGSAWGRRAGQRKRIWLEWIWRKQTLFYYSAFIFTLPPLFNNFKPEAPLFYKCFLLPFNKRSCRSHQLSYSYQIQDLQVNFPI